MILAGFILLVLGSVAAVSTEWLVTEKLSWHTFPSSKKFIKKSIPSVDEHFLRDNKKWNTYLSSFTPKEKSPMPHKIHRVLNPVAANKLAKKLLKKAPLALQEIARCESRERHYDERTGYVLQGKTSPSDVGLFQIKSTKHERDARRAGLNIYAIRDNFIYATALYSLTGTRHWRWSEHCWGPKVPAKLRLPLEEQM